VGYSSHLELEYAIVEERGKKKREKGKRRPHVSLQRRGGVFGRLSVSSGHKLGHAKKEQEKANRRKKTREEMDYGLSLKPLS